jgi:hypothetical protein
MVKPKAPKRLTREDYANMDDIELAKHAHSRPWWMHTLAKDELNHRFEAWSTIRNNTQENQRCPQQSQLAIT